MMKMLIWAVLLSAYACFNQSSCKDQKGHSGAVINEAGYRAQDSLILDIDELKKIYTQAIAEFIKAAYIKDKTTFDTLYFGKHQYGQEDDFPDIELPLTIEHTQIRLVNPEVGLKLQKARKSLIYINMMGWIEKSQAEFLFVVFTNGAQHQYDYFIKFLYNASKRYFELDQITFENYLQIIWQKAQKNNNIQVWRIRNRKVIRFSISTFDR